MIYNAVIFTLFCQAVLTHSATQENNRASLSKETLKVNKKDAPAANVGIEICYETFWRYYYCPDGYICCTPGSPESGCCPVGKPLCVDDKYCCITGHPQICGDFCCTSDAYCCNNDHCCKDEKSCAENQQCCVEETSYCKTGPDKKCCNDDTQACCDGGYGCVQPCTSPFDAVGCYADDETSLKSPLAILTLKQEDEKLKDIKAFEKLYRVLRPEETPSVGLIAKDRTANKTVRSHVNCGSRRNYASQWISTTTSLAVALRYQKETPGSRIAVIDRLLLPVSTLVIDLTIQAVRDLYLGKAVCANYAKKSEEVLLSNDESSIPFTYYEKEQGEMHIEVP